jgi:nitrate/TMAO reductase-like tetraheme cytochrome c subunit
MRKWIILKMLHPLQFKMVINQINEIAVCHPKSSMLKVFDTLEEASNYQEEHGISGQCVELPIY